MKGDRILCMWGEGIVALNTELATDLHKELEIKLSKYPPEETELRLSEIAVHCSILLDGQYGPENINELCAILAGRLELLREVIVPQKIIDLH